MAAHSAFVDAAPGHIVNMARVLGGARADANHTGHYAAEFTRRNKLLHFHTKAHFIQQLQNAPSFKSLTCTHSDILKRGFLNDTFATNHAINSYVRYKQIASAHQLLDEMVEPNVVSWTSVISGYVRSGQPEMAISLFRDMYFGCVVPNCFTFSTVISACSSLANIELGKKVHAQAVVFGFQRILVLCSSLVDMYGKCNVVDDARRVFDSMSQKNVVCWTSMISGYAANAQGDTSLLLLREYNKQDLPNKFMLCSVINACASLGRLVPGKVTHGVIIRFGHDREDVVATSLVDMYGKCGCIEYSRKVFSGVSNPSLILYTSIIVGTAKHGLGKLSLQLYNEMIERRIKPSYVTFLGVLHACSHSGFVDEGLQYLKSMYNEHGIVPNAGHQTCVVDMLGRVGRLDEAYELAKSFKVTPDEGGLLWGTLLSSSRLHGRVDIAVEASKWLIQSEQQVAAAYVTMSNAYALAGKWENVHSTRIEMKRNGVYKKPGCSWLEIKDAVYVFYAGDVASCPRGEEVMKLLKELESRIKDKGYVGGSLGLVLVDVEDEAKEEFVSLHSERLALGFGLLTIPKGLTIRIIKNLRICWDCHEAFKLISEIVERDFVVRDVNRFHHFRNGTCTCKDFW